ncbi:uncharacterized protein LOC131948585 [Physella acuta]|uniref:uncharacterized protein LOC131948585 n=1 Tax=Physella acuta TaxID=109671 RepID=UPI0027DD755F|nr:uncharacterized protein LOC131948585 [Physella acuta]
MIPHNMTDYFDRMILPLHLQEFNVSSFEDASSDILNMGHVRPVSQMDNATQLFLANGTRTRAPKYFNPSERMVSMTLPMVMKLSYYTCPAIMAIGVLSNVLSYLVFTRTRLRKIPSVPYLAAMSVVDSGALVTEFIQMGLVQHGLNLITWSGVCQYVTYFNFVFIFLCIWYPVALCVEKLISVYCPLKKAALCTPFRAKVVVIGMAVMTGTCYYYVIYMTGPLQLGSMMFCREWKEFRFDYGVLMTLDSIFVSILPSFILVLLVVLICFRGCEYYRISSAAEVSNRNGSARSYSIRAPIRVTNVIFPIVFIILVLRLPLSCMRIYGMMSSSFGHFGLNLQPIFLYLSRFEWAIKLYIYLVFSPSFRRRTRSFLCNIRSKFKGRCQRNSSDDDDLEGTPAAPPINLAQTLERGDNHRACLMSSDV